MRLDLADTTFTERQSVACRHRPVECGVRSRDRLTVLHRHRLRSIRRIGIRNLLLANSPFAQWKSAASSHAAFHGRVRCDGRVCDATECEHRQYDAPEDVPAFHLNLRHDEPAGPGSFTRCHGESRVSPKARWRRGKRESQRVGLLAVRNVRATLSAHVPYRILTDSRIAHAQC